MASTSSPFDSEPRRIALFGSTGSIGGNVLKVIDELPGRFLLTVLAAGGSIEKLAAQAARYAPARLAIADPADLPRLREALRAAGVVREPELHAGREALAALAANADYDLLVLATVGVAALPASLAALRRGAAIALANKEILVAAGALVMAEAAQHGATILPIDSEHSALHQCLRAGHPAEVARLILTASGGPFRDRPLAELAAVTPQEALRHPTWRMGRRVTLDAATLMNKGFEVIEACHLFAVEPPRVDVVIHPQSIVHSLLEFRDGSVMAQLGTADMCTPIQYALTYPHREATTRRKLDLTAVGRLDFLAPDLNRYPCLRLAREALEAGGAAPAILNAADEVAVAAFCAGRIEFPALARVVEQVLSKLGPRPAGNLGEILAADNEARRAAEALIAAPAFVSA